MNVMYMDSFVDDALLGVVAAGQDYRSDDGDDGGYSWDDSTLFTDPNTIPSVTPGASPPHTSQSMMMPTSVGEENDSNNTVTCGYVEEEVYECPPRTIAADDRTLASFGLSCMSVGSQSGVHSLSSSLAEQQLRSSIMSVHSLASSAGVGGEPRQREGSANMSDWSDALSSLFSEGGGGDLDNYKNNYDQHVVSSSSYIPASQYDAMKVLRGNSQRPVSLYRDSIAYQETLLNDTWLPTSQPVLETATPPHPPVVVPPPAPPMPPPRNNDHYNTHLLLQEALLADLISSSSNFPDHHPFASPSLCMPPPQFASSPSPSPPPMLIQQAPPPRLSSAVPPPPINNNIINSTCTHSNGVVRGEQGKPTVVKAMKTKTKQQKEKGMLNGRKIRLLMTQNGTKHVYFGRGEPVRENPGNIRFRSIVDKYYGEYQRASKKVKLDIKQRIESEVKSDGSKFIVIVEQHGNFTHELASSDKIKDGTGHALRDTPKRRATYWSWSDPSMSSQQESSHNNTLLWTTFSSKDGTALEQMYAETIHLRTNVKVTIRREDYFVDVTSMTMFRASENNYVDSHNNVMYRVRRLEPEEGSESGEHIYVTDSDGQFEHGTGGSSKYSSSASQASCSSNSTSFSKPSSSSSGGVVQSSLYCTLGMSHDSKTKEDTTTYSVNDATQEEILQVITNLLEGEETEYMIKGIQTTTSNTTTSQAPTRRTSRGRDMRSEQDEDEDEDTVSALQPPLRKMNSVSTSDAGGSCASGGAAHSPATIGGGGTLRSGLVKRIKNVKFGSNLPLSFGKKRDSSSGSDVTSEEQQKEVTTAIWVWRENKTRMDRHTLESIEGDPKDCWIRYDEDCCAILEAAYREQKGVGECTTKLHNKYTVDFKLMRQLNTSTGYQRQVRRIESTSVKEPEPEPYQDSSIPSSPPCLPADSTALGKMTRKMASMRVGSQQQQPQDMMDDNMTLGDCTAPTTTDESVSLGWNDDDAAAAANPTRMVVRRQGNAF